MDLPVVPKSNLEILFLGLNPPRGGIILETLKKSKLYPYGGIFLLHLLLRNFWKTGKEVFKFRFIFVYFATMCDIMCRYFLKIIPGVVMHVVHAHLVVEPVPAQGNIRLGPGVVPAGGHQIVALQK